MTDRVWILAACAAALVCFGVATWTSYDAGYEAGVRHGRALGRADADHRVATARAECHDLLANQRAWYEGLHDRAAVVWKENTAALLRDLTAYERDLEHCRRCR